ncbi:hypothetical protein NG895_14580 [Aeoliella sp. ICT_H6.2]|uniref:Uncharacterized protein n=1 Tax=Aeoliella straminimaris TaxID=2954799 RepID=A0A9X2JJL7_9BACT|nr:hypothetical protein [Aeoliella straminimaris]MCO6045134.1 hypothetical protein [Aeoliella straminimaris]
MQFRARGTGTRLSIEQLENKDLLAIVWANESAALNTFDLEYGVNNATTAQAVVNRAISDWNAVINSFNYAEDLDANPSNDLNDTYYLSVFAEDLGGGTRGQVQFADTQYNVDNSPISGTIRLDDNGGGAGWFFGPMGTPSQSCPCWNATSDHPT